MHLHQKLNVMNLWVISIIWCSTSIILFNVGL